MPSIIKKVYNDEETIVYLNCGILFKQYCDIRTKREQSFYRNRPNPSKKKNPTSKGDTPISRSIIQTANAYLYNNTVCVDFNEVLPTVTILLINESTSETVYAEACDTPTNISINLDKESCSNYFIQIESDGVFLYGNFTL